MATVTSPNDICNLALDDLKQSPIKNILTPTSNTEFIMARNYDPIRRECLTDHPWKFAIKRDQWTPNPTTVPLFGYANAYDVPVDYLRLITVGDDYLGNLKQAYEVENNQLLAVQGDTLFDGTTKDIRYLRDITDVTKFSPLFVIYFRLKLALRLANKFAISSSLKQSIKADFDEVAVTARAVNGQESKIKRIQYSRILTKRRGLQSDIWASKYTIFDN